MRQTGRRRSITCRSRCRTRSRPHDRVLSRTTPCDASAWHAARAGSSGRSGGSVNKLNKHPRVCRRRGNAPGALAQLHIGLRAYMYTYPGARGRSSRFQPSLKGRSTRQTASTRVGELSTRYMRPFRTSLTEIYSYGTTVHMSILSRRFMRRAQIMPTSRLARATGSQCHHAHSTDPCRAR